MDNRQPTPGMEGRVLIIPEDGSAPFYAKMTMADNPLVEGTPWAKETVLPDTTCKLLRISTSSEPKDAFEAIPKIATRTKESIFQKLMTGRFI